MLVKTALSRRKAKYPRTTSTDKVKVIVGTVNGRVANPTITFLDTPL